ncbi:MAG: zinc-ribbon domain-containing protein [bacterium]
MADKTLTCVECGQEFIFSEDEQQFYSERGFQEPKRCKSCRAKRKRDRRGSRGLGGPGRGYNR